MNHSEHETTQISICPFALLRSIQCFKVQISIFIHYWLSLFDLFEVHFAQCTLQSHLVQAINIENAQCNDAQMSYNA